MSIYLNGALVEPDAAVVSVDDRGFLFGDGVYEVIRSYGGRFFALDAHLRRMHDGLCALRIHGVDAAELGPVADELLVRNAMTDTDGLVYLQVTRGAAPRRHAFPEPNTRPTVYARAMPFHPKGDPAAGIAVITTPDIRWARCDIKTVNLLPNCLANQRAQEAGATEAIFVRDGVALEGTATSFFGVFGGEVRTAPRTNYILPSVTRGIVLDLCRRHDVPAREDPIFVEELGEADELFLAGTTMEVMPIVTVDGRAVGTATPGDVTRQLQTLFRTVVDEGRP